MRLAFIIAAAALAGVGSAGALAPPLPICGGVLLAPEEAAWSDYDAFGNDGGIISYTRIGGPDETLYQVVVEHCPSRNRMEAEFIIPADADAEWTDIRAYLDWLIDAFAATETYSFVDLANAAQGFGGTARVAQVDYESCGCRGRVQP